MKSDYTSQDPNPGSKSPKFWSHLSLAVAVLVIISFALGVTARLDQSYGRDASIAGMSAALPQAGTVDMGEDVRPLQTMLAALGQLRQLYVERIEDSQDTSLTYGSLSKMLESLGDPHSRFLKPDQRKLAEDALKGEFHGIGAALDVGTEKTANGVESRLLVIAAVPGSPAEKAGLQPGDSIRDLDGKWLISYDPYAAAAAMVSGVRNRKIDPSALRKVLMSAKKKLDDGITIQKAADLLTSRDTGDFSLMVVRKGASKPVKIAITPGLTKALTMEHKTLDSKVGYIKVNYFGDSTANDFADALAELGKDKVTSLVLDLRNAPGGSTAAATRVAEWLAPGKVFAQLAKARNARETVRIPFPAKSPENKTAVSSSAAIRKPVAVLVNAGTSSAAETLAASLKDNGSAFIVGSTTHGDFMQRTMLVLQDGSAVNFTTGKYLTPKGKDLNGKGLPADIAVPASGSGDAQLAKALSVLRIKAGS